MKRLLIGSLILPILGTSSTVHARGTLFDMLGFGKKKEEQKKPQQGSSRQRFDVEEYSPFDDRYENYGEDIYGDDFGSYDDDQFGSPFGGGQLQIGYQNGVGNNGNASTTKPAPATNESKVYRVTKTPLMSNEALYKALGMTAIWTTADGRMTMQAIQLRETLLNAEYDGLVSSDYWTAELEAMYNSASAANAAALESKMTAAFIKFATHVAVGRVNPDAAGDEVKISPRSMKAETLAGVLMNTSADLKTSMESIKPQWKAYRDLRIALATMRMVNANEVFPAFEAPKKGLKVGDSNAAVSAVKRRLGTLGYALSDTSDVVTEEFKQVVRRYMTDHGNQNPSDVGDLDKSSRFWERIGIPLSARMSQMQLTMEKLRWVKQTPETRHIQVNLAFQRLRVYDGNGIVMAMKTINGRMSRKTPMLQDKVINIILNPTWTVPASLIIKDKLPALRQDPMYIEKNHFSIWDANFERQYDPNRIDWFRVTDADVNKFYLVQAPGLGNALGVMKFNLTNGHAIYLHDTNERHLFAGSDRLLSSGCVRVERPFDLAAYLLQSNPQWNSVEALQSAVSRTQWAEDSYPAVKNKHQINLDNSMPVYLMYLTAEVDPETGILKLGTDFYGQDQRLFESLKTAAGR